MRPGPRQKQGTWTAPFLAGRGPDPAAGRSRLRVHGGMARGNKTAGSVRSRPLRWDQAWSAAPG